jgi:hypothetical protein
MGWGLCVQIVEKVNSRRNNYENQRRIKMNPEIIMIGDIKYVRADSIKEQADKLDGMRYVIVRTYSAGVFAGYLESREGQEVVVRKARRLWRWSGAASLSQLAMEGIKNPKDCKFPCEVDRVELLQTIEILDVTKQAQQSISEVEIWKD